MSKTILLNIFILIVVLKHLLCDETDESVEVHLKQGILSGKVEKSFLKNKKYYAFRGIPYAEPPIGALRFKPPQPHEKWEGTYQAHKNKPTCMQFCARMRNNEPLGLSGAENCLYLSVYTPELKGNYPVIVFDFNDQFKTGFNGSDTYSPDFFIEEDIIVVTITHRLNVFGYLTTEDDVIPPNNGVRDFLLGLNWVQNNIQKFGGDPSKVTLMGYKSGAALANLLLYTEQAKGLFSAVILQSGTVFEPSYFFENPRKKAFQLAEILDIKSEDSQTLLEELQKIDAVKLKENEVMVRGSEELEKFQMSINMFAPTVEKNHENAIITDLPEKSKIKVDVPVIIGLTSREGLDFIEDYLFNPKLFEQILGGITMHLPIRSGFRFNRDSLIYSHDASREINEMYYKDGYLHLGNVLQYSVLLGDTITSYAIDKASKYLAKELGSPVYYYMFDYRGIFNENMNTISRYSVLDIDQKGATATDDLCYLHLCSRIRKTYEYLNSLVTKQPEFKILDKMVRMWTNFAKTRNPTPDQEDNILKGITWQPIDKESQQVNYLHIAKALKMKKEPLGQRSKFWDEFLEKYSKLAVDGVVTDTKTTDKSDKIYVKNLKYETEEIGEQKSDPKDSKKADLIGENHKENEDVDKMNDIDKVKSEVNVDEKIVVVESYVPLSHRDDREPVNLPYEETHDEL